MRENIRKIWHRFQFTSKTWDKLIVEMSLYLKRIGIETKFLNIKQRWHGYGVDSII